MENVHDLTQLLMSQKFWIFAIIGFVAQMFDGALGMGFGVISYTVLTMMGFEPKIISATVNSAKIFTGGASTIGHLIHRNVDWRMLGRLCISGIIGAMLGVAVLTQMPVNFLKIILSVYLLCIGGYILLSATSVHHRTEASARRTLLIGGLGGFLESVAGVYGPLVTSNMVASGSNPRFVIGSGNVSETAVAIAVTIVLARHVDLSHMATITTGLVAGALIASPIAARLTRKVPPRTLMIAVGTLVIVTSLARLIQTLS
jgi:uncharacterized protein